MENGINLTKKLIEIIKMFLHFWFFTCRPHPFHTLIMFYNNNFGKHIFQKLKRKMLILKFHPGMKYLHVIFSFSHPGMKFHPCPWDEISFQQKRVNSKRHFTCKHPLRVISQHIVNYSRYWMKEPVISCA